MPEDKAGFVVSPLSLPTQSNIWSSLIDGCQWSLSFILRHIHSGECRFFHICFDYSGMQISYFFISAHLQNKQCLIMSILFIFFYASAHTFIRLFLFVSVCSCVWAVSPLCLFMSHCLCVSVCERKTGRERRSASSVYYLCEAYGR